MRSVCVFCGSSGGGSPVYAAAARDLGRLLAQRGIRLVFGGGSVGLMGAVADAVLEHGGAVTGVIPHALWAREVGHRQVPDLRIVDTMHERKALMASLADAFVALPGGLGTLEELFEIWTWAQLGIHAKPCGVLDVAGFFTPLLAFLDHAVSEGFLRQPYRAMLQVDDQPDRLLERLRTTILPDVPKWLDRSQT